MDFFTRQEKARRNTTLLVVLFFLALAGIIASAYLAITAIVQVAFSDPDAPLAFRPRYHPDLFLGVSSLISLTVFGGTAFKLAQLRQGGGKVAEMLGGRLLHPASTQFHERRLLNVVEEMALASGVPVPPVYVMPGQHGINAFAAGYSPFDAVIGMTEGAMRGLNREELQGVVAHEFSHILHGDMRLNIRLMGVLHGLLVLALVGRAMLRVAGSGRSSSGKKGGGGVALVVALGLALLIIGYFGYFFGGLIKRAVSRQREYLADASAVQFTRNPAGLATALKKIGGLAQAGVVRHDRAEELSHMFFADGIKRFMGAGSLFSTHPPLVKRITLLDPAFDGEFPLVTPDMLLAPSPRDDATPASSSRTAMEKGRTMIKRSVMLGGAVVTDPASVMQQVGVLEVAGLESTQQIIAELPAALREKTREPVGAQAVILALLLQKANGQDSDAWVWVPTSLTDPVGQCMEALAAIKPEQRLLLVELAVPALRGLSREAAERFVEALHQVVVADRQVRFFEFAVKEIVMAALRATLGHHVPPIRHHAIKPLWKECRVLLSMLAHAGQADDALAARAFEAATAVLGAMPRAFTLLRMEDMDMDDWTKALHRMLGAAMPARKQLIEAALACLLHDREATMEEIELFRAFAAVLEVPVPPGEWVG